MEKIKVPGGWIVNQLHDISDWEGELKYQATATFVKDKNHEWEKEEHINTILEDSLKEIFKEVQTDYAYKLSKAQGIGGMHGLEAKKACAANDAIQDLIARIKNELHI